MRRPSLMRAHAYAPTHRITPLNPLELSCGFRCEGGVDAYTSFGCGRKGASEGTELR